MYSNIGSSYDYHGAFEVFFVLGKPKDNKENSERDTIKIMEENNQFGDIIQIDIEETYHNCFYKGKSNLL